MKNIVRLFALFCAFIFSSQVAFAGVEKETVPEGADISSIRILAIGLPDYYPVGDKAPTEDELLKIIYTASKKSKTEIMSYDSVAQSIRSDKKIDIKVLNKYKARKYFLENVGKYADAYVVTTVANNSRTVFFFDVYKPGEKEMSYRCEIRAEKYDADDELTYAKIAEQFYKEFDNAIESQQKKAAKKEKNKDKD